MTIFTDGLRAAPELSIDELGEPRGVYLAAKAGEAVESMPLVSQLPRSLELSVATGGDAGLFDVGELAGAAELHRNRFAGARDVPMAEAKARVQREGLDKTLHLGDAESIRAPALDIMIERARARREREATIARGPDDILTGALGLGTSLLVSALDPLNVAAAFVPVVGEARYAKLMYDAGGILGRIGVRAGVGALEGAIGIGALQPLEALVRTQEGQDFTFAEALRNTMYGAAFGTLLRSGGGLGADVVRGVRGKPLYPFAAGEPFGPSPAVIDTRPAVYDDVIEQLRATGMAPEEAAANAAIVAARYGARAERLGTGESAIELYRGEGLAIRRGESGPAIEGQTFEQPTRPQDISAGPYGRTNLFEQDREYWRGNWRRIVASGSEQPVRVLRQNHVLAEVANHDRQITISPIIARDIRGKHPDVPAAVWENLPELIADPDYAFPFRDGIVNVVIATKTAKGEPIVVGVRDGEVRTITPRHNTEDGSGSDALARMLDGALSHGRKVYVKDASVAAALGPAAQGQQRGIKGPQRQGSVPGANLPEARTPDQQLVWRPPRNVLSLDQLINRRGRVFYQDGGEPSAPTFYSAVERAVTEAKQEKASPDQWLGMLRNRAGVKPEEMQWLGLEDWLRSQKGPVTKQAVSDYVRANAIEVREVQKPTPGSAARIEQINQEIVALEAQGLPPYRELHRMESEYGSLPEAEREQRYAFFERVAPLSERRSELVGERMALEAQGSTKFGEHTLAGGENYRELLLTLPQDRPANASRMAQLEEEITRLERAGDPRWRDLSRERGELLRQGARESYTSSHFDEPNVLAHVRFDDRVIDGKKTLFLEEVQSDWHQAGKRKGYKDALTAERRAELEAERKSIWAMMPEPSDIDRVMAQHGARLTEIERDLGNLGAVPNAPFKTTWPELVLKRMIRYAAENGYEKIAWTSGKTQAERYDLSKQISEVKFTRSGSSGFTPLDEIKGYESGTLTARDHDGVVVIDRYVKGEELPDYIGKDVAERLLAQEPKGGSKGGTATATQTLSGLDLKVGGEGMAGFYDKMLPAAANKLTKKFGGKVERAEVDTTPVSSADRQAAIDAPSPAGSVFVYEAETRHGRAVFEVHDSNTGAVVETFATRAEAERLVERTNGAIASGLEMHVRGAHFDVVESETGILVERFASREAAQDYMQRQAPVAAGFLEKVHALEIAPRLREAAVGEGFPLFQRDGEGAPRGRITLADRVSAEAERAGRLAELLDEQATLMERAAGGKVTAADATRAEQLRAEIDALKDPPGGQITTQKGRAIIELFAAADRSTFMHEMSHLWIDELARDARMRNVPQAIKDDLGTVLRWLGAERFEDLTVAQHEQWARGFEQYLAEGNAPSSALARAFDNFKRWLAAIYNSLTELGRPLSDDVRAVMDRMLATDAELARRPAPSPIEVLADLPPRAQEDAMRGSIAALHDGEPVRAGEMLEAAARTDPRIAESINGGGAARGDAAPSGTAEAAKATELQQRIADGENRGEDTAALRAELAQLAEQRAAAFDQAMAARAASDAAGFNAGKAEVARLDAEIAAARAGAWRDLATHRLPEDEPDAITASTAAVSAREPASIAEPTVVEGVAKPSKSTAAAQAAEQDAAERYKWSEETGAISEQEAAAFKDALRLLDDDAATRKQLLELAAGCLMTSGFGAVG